MGKDWNTARESRETVTNLSLVKNTLDHIDFELNRDSTSFFRVARDAHYVLFGAMIDALRGTAPFDIVKARNGKVPVGLRYTSDNVSWQEVVKGPVVKGCKTAFRCSEPRSCEPPHGKDDCSTDDESPESSPEELFKDLYSRDLIGFYPALAKVQTQCHMHRYVHSKAVTIDDEEMQLLEWVNEEIRNEFEHFMPKHYAVCIYTSILGTLVCMRVARELLFESGNVRFDSLEQRVQIQEVLDRISSRLQEARMVREDNQGEQLPDS